MRGITHDKELIYFDFPLPRTHENNNTPTEITIRNDRTASSSPALSRLNSRPNSSTPNTYSQQRATRRNDSRDSYRQKYTAQESRNNPGTRENCISRPYPPVSRLLASTTIEVQQFPIGIALGSPSHLPPYLQAMSAPAPPQRSMTMPTGWQPAPPTERHRRNKTGKWKLFGIFGRKITAPEDGQAAEVKQQAEEQGRPIHSKTISRGKLNLEKSRHELFKVKSEPAEGKASPFIETRAIAHEISVAMTRDSMNARKGDREQQVNKDDGMLGVDIPTVHMERYSIMFSQLLEKTQPKSNEGTSALLARRKATIERLETVNESTSALLARRKATIQRLKTVSESTSALLVRRKATIERLKTVNETIAELETQEAAQLQKSRRLTSPANAPLPSSLSPFPGGKQLVPNHLSRRLMRSKSSPALSPRRQTFADNLALHSQPVRPHGLPLSIVPALSTVVPQRASTLSDDSDPETPPVQGQATIAQLKPQLIEPEWEMIEIAPVRSRKRANTAHSSSQPGAQRSRANTATSGTSGSSAASTTSARSAESSATTISTSSTPKHSRSMPKINIRDKPALEPYPYGIVPTAPTQGMTGLVLASGNSVSEPRTLVDPSAAGWPGSPRLTREIRIPISKFATASRPARKESLPTAAVSASTLATATSLVHSGNVSDAGGESEAEVHMVKTVEVSIARRISVSRQQSQMLRSRPVTTTVGVRQQEVTKVKMVFREQMGLMPRRMESVNRKSECGILEGYDAVKDWGRTQGEVMIYDKIPGMG